MSIEIATTWAIAAIIAAVISMASTAAWRAIPKSTSRFGAAARFARRLRQFRRGACDPALRLGARRTRSVGWIAALVFAICAAAPARALQRRPPRRRREPEWQRDYFVGIPAPAGALIVFLPVYLEFIGAPHGFLTAPIVTVYCIAIGILMVSRLPTWSSKLVGRRIPRDMVLPLFVVVVLVVALLLSFPWQTMTALSIAYLASLPLSWRAFRKRLTEDEASPRYGSPRRQRPDAGGDEGRRLTIVQCRDLRPVL